MAAARVERMRYTDKVAGAVQGKTAGPPPLQSREQPLFPPAPDKPGSRRLRLAGWTQLPERLEQRHHRPKIGGIAGAHVPSSTRRARGRLLGEQPRHRFDATAVGKDFRRQRSIVDPQMIAEQALQYGAQIGRRLQITVLVKIGLL